MAKSKKGSTFERNICKRLSLWWTDNENDAVFWRTSGSGARATVRSKQKKKTKNEYGDVGYTDDIGKTFINLFLIELKRGYTKEVDTLSFVDNLNSSKDPLLLRWWKKAERERRQARRKYTLIIFKRDRHKDCVMFKSLLFNLFEQYCGRYKYHYIELNKCRLIVVRLKDFFKWVDRDTIENYF